MLVGCCDGLTCVTSAINTNYGVCVAGEGGTVSIGTTLISPFSENVEQEVAAIAASETSSSTTTTDPDLEREQRLAEIKARKDARRLEQQTRRTAKKTEQQLRRDDRQEARQLRRGPRLELELFLPTNDTSVEILKVTNRDDEIIVLSRIESLPPVHSIEVTPEQSLAVGEAFLFVSGGPSSEQGIKGNRHGWSTTRICDDFEGITVHAARSVNSVNHQRTISCEDSTVGGSPDRRKKRRRKRNGGRNDN
jgi:hypothetical protein